MALQDTRNRGMFTDGTEPDGIQRTVMQQGIQIGVRHIIRLIKAVDQPDPSRPIGDALKHTVWMANEAAHRRHIQAFSLRQAAAGGE